VVEAVVEVLSSVARRRKDAAGRRNAMREDEPMLCMVEKAILMYVGDRELLRAK
jgi:hypothetical protein